MGQKMDQVLPIPPTALQLSTGIAVLSYGDELVFGITADYDAASEMQQLVNGIELGVARLVALSDDSVLLFTKDRRKRSSRALPSAARRGGPLGRPPERVTDAISVGVDPRERVGRAQVGPGHHRSAPP